MSRIALRLAASGPPQPSPMAPSALCQSSRAIAQVVFFEADEICQTSYGDKKGKYQAQRHITLPKI